MTDLTAGRKIIAKLLANIFSIALLLFPAAIFATFWLSNPAALKQLLADSQMYGAISETVVDQTAGQFTAAMNTRVALEPSAVEESLQSVFTPALMQKKTEKLIDENHAWLEGDRAESSTDITIENEERQLLDEFSQAAVRSVQQKPTCDVSQLSQYQAQLQANPLQAPCRIAGVSQSELERRVRTVINSQIAIQDEQQLSGLTFNNARSTTAAMSEQGEATIRLLYWVLKHGFMLLLSVLLLAGTLAAVTLRSKWRWLAWIRSPLISTGIFVLISAVLLAIFTQTSWVTIDALSESARQSISVITQPLLIVTSGAGAIYIMSGMFAILATKIRRKHVRQTNQFDVVER